MRKQIRKTKKIFLKLFLKLEKHENDIKNFLGKIKNSNFKVSCYKYKKKSGKQKRK